MYFEHRNFVRTMIHLDFALYFKALGSVFSYWATIEEKNNADKYFTELFSHTAGSLHDVWEFFFISPESVIDLPKYHKLVTFFIDLFQGIEDPKNSLLTFEEYYLWLSKLKYSKLTISQLEALRVHLNSALQLLTVQLESVRHLIQEIKSRKEGEVDFVRKKEASFAVSLPAVKKEDYSSNMTHLDFYLYFKVLGEACRRLKDLMSDDKFLKIRFEGFNATISKIMIYIRDMSSLQKLNLHDYSPLLLTSIIEPPYRHFSTFAECYLYLSKLGLNNIDFSDFKDHLEIKFLYKLSYARDIVRWIDAENESPKFQPINILAQERTSSPVVEKSSKPISLATEDDFASALATLDADITFNFDTPVQLRVPSPIAKSASPTTTQSDFIPWMIKLGGDDCSYIAGTHNKSLNSHPVFCTTCDKYSINYEQVVKNFPVVHSSCFYILKMNYQYFERLEPSKRDIVFKKCKQYIDQHHKS